MLKGAELIAKIIELDGLPISDIIAQCGYEVGELLLDDDFYISLSKYAESYVSELSKLRKKKLANSGDMSCNLLLKRLGGEQLLSRVEALDNFFQSGPPWSEKKKIVIKCGYVRLTKDADIIVEYEAFHDAYTEAEEQEMISSIGNIGEEQVDPLQVSDSTVRIAKRNSDDLIDQAACLLVELSQCICQSLPSRALYGIRIEYAGGGDDGEICAVDFLFTESPSIVHAEYDNYQATSMPEFISFKGKKLCREDYEGLIREYSFSISYNCHGNWFNECGGNGFLFVDIGSSVLLGCHYQNEDPDGFPEHQAPFASPYFIATQDV
jgi:hypothetical protein